MTVLASILAIYLTLTGVTHPAEDDPVSDVALALSVAVLEAATGTEAEQVFEAYPDGRLWIGAVSLETEFSAGFSFSPEGVVFEAREP